MLKKCVQCNSIEKNTQYKDLPDTSTVYMSGSIYAGRVSSYSENRIPNIRSEKISDKWKSKSLIIRPDIWCMSMLNSKTHKKRMDQSYSMTKYSTRNITHSISAFRAISRKIDNLWDSVNKKIENAYKKGKHT